MKNYNSDLEMAKDLLYSENLTICIVKNNKIVLKSTKRGILPMYIAITGHFNELSNASIADRVIGRAAAMLNAYSKTQSVYTEIISQSALDIFNDSKINIHYSKVVPHIKNRSKDDLCPIEKISSKVTDKEYSVLINKINKFLTTINAI